MTDHDAATGEVYTNGHRATLAATQTHLQLQRDRMGVGDNLLHDAVWMALQSIPEWVTASKEGARGKYAPLKDILQAVRPHLHKNRVRVRQGAEMSRTADEGGGVKGRLVPVYTDLIHVPSGQVERTIVEMPISRMDAQAMGSAITYGKRYSLLAALGLATDEADDDGERAKASDITAPAKTSAVFDELLADMKSVKDIVGLTKLVSDPKNRKKIDGLTEGEQERLRLSYAELREKLSAE